MKIAQIAPIWYSIPPKKNIGGAEYIVGELTNELVKNGHDVTLFATGDSLTSAKLVSFIPKGIGENGLPQGREFFLTPLLHFVKSLDYIKANNFDIIHCHFSTLADYVLFGLIRDLPNIVITNHQVFPDKKLEPDRFTLFQHFSHLNFVDISKTQQNPDLPLYPIVPNGIVIPNLPEIKKTEKIVWMSRIAPEKGLLEAIKASKKLQKEFDFAGAIKREKDRPYFEECMSQIEPGISYKGIVRDSDKFNFLGNAKLFLFPITWNEPFGLVIVEAMVTGTPIVAFANGAAREIVKDGVTGFLVNESKEKIHGDYAIKKVGLEGLEEAIQRIYDMSPDEYEEMRENSNKHVLENYTMEKMTNGYEAIYQRVQRNFDKI
ncbi:MAG TPA: glycosyltransferase [Patescibacteria group bacterium]